MEYKRGGNPQIPIFYENWACLRCGKKTQITITLENTPSVNPKAKSARSTGLHYIHGTERAEIGLYYTHCKIHNMCKTHVLAVFAKHLFLALTCTFTFSSCLIDPTAVLQTVGIARAICRQRVSPLSIYPGLAPADFVGLDKKMSPATICLSPQKRMSFLAPIHTKL